MLKIVKSTAAEGDLVDIWVYSFEYWGIKQADKYLAQLDDGFRFLASNPLVGINCEDIRTGYFSYPIKKHTVFYQVESEKLNIIRVLGEEMSHYKQFE